jgi:hypothetical protein
MSRVEPKGEHAVPPRQAEPRRRELSDRKPEKAEGDEDTIEEALERQENR